MSEPDSEFDDPALRGAVRRACARQTAPPELRRRVEALVGAATAAAAAVETRPARGWPRWMGTAPLKLGAVAAACFIAVGVAAMQVWDTFGPQPTPPIVQRVSFPVSVTAEMIRTHDNCAQ